MSSRAVVRVIESFREPKPTTNPYITTLTEVLRRRPGIELHTFSFRRGILGAYDVLHIHWPEVLTEGHRRLGRWGRQVLTALLLLRLTLTRTSVVRTVHNLEKPSGVSPFQRLLLDWFDRLTVMRICLNDRTAAVIAEPSLTILHGHYRERYAPLADDEADPHLIQYFGLVRRYKGVEQLIEAFAGTDDPCLRLRISGSPTSSELAETLDRLAGNDPRISLELAFLSDADLATRIRQASLIVLPYRAMHNSGAVLTALSLDRPVLVPANDVNRDLAAEVGASWVLTFDGELTSGDLNSALSRAHHEDEVHPDLSRREWSMAGEAHEHAFREALSRSHGRRVRFGSPATDRATKR